MKQVAAGQLHYLGAFLHLLQTNGTLACTGGDLDITQERTHCNPPLPLSMLLTQCDICCSLQRRQQ